MLLQREQEQQQQPQQRWITANPHTKAFEISPKSIVPIQSK